MKQGIIITSHESTTEFLKESLLALRKCNYPVLVKFNTQGSNDWEIGGIKRGMQLFDEFLYLQDTCIVKDISILKTIFDTYKNKSVSLMDNYNAYLGKYQTEILNQIAIPETKTKEQAIIAERDFTKDYMTTAGDVIQLFPELNGWGVPKYYREYIGRNNAIYENDYFIKYKGTWK